MKSDFKSLRLRAEEKLINQLSLMSRSLQPPKDTRTFLEDLMDGLRRGSVSMEDFSSITRAFVLQPITRAKGKRRSATNMLIKLLSYVESNDYTVFKKYIEKLEKRLNDNGRSYFEK